MQTMDPRKESVEDENDENGKKVGIFFFGGLPAGREVWLWRILGLSLREMG